MLNSFEAEEAFLVVPCSIGSGVEADLGEQLLLSFLGSGDDVFSDGLPFCMFSPYHFLVTIDKCFS